MAQLRTSLSRFLVSGDCRRQTHSTRSTPSRVDGELSDIQHEAKNLRLGSTWVTNEENVDISVCELTQFQPLTHANRSLAPLFSLVSLLPFSPSPVSTPLFLPADLQ